MAVLCLIDQQMAPPEFWAGVWEKWCIVFLKFELLFRFFTFFYCRTCIFVAMCIGSKWMLPPVPFRQTASWTGIEPTGPQHAVTRLLKQSRALGTCFGYKSQWKQHHEWPWCFWEENMQRPSLWKHYCITQELHLAPSWSQLQPDSGQLCWLLSFIFARLQRGCS